MDLSIRNFFHSSAIGAAAFINIPAIVASCIRKDEKSVDEQYSFFQTGNTILFQGDPITEAR